ncbi:MAG TPA: uridine kinase [Bryobacteraceae bacterium]|nr:uridine kinase [Bryobacteraceae bacterium]
MRPHIIGVAGPSSSGKTELARRVAASLHGAEIVSLDSYYRGREDLPFEQREQLNFDHPNALEWELLHEHLRGIQQGRAFEEPVYSFARHARAPGSKRIEPAPFLIIEGLFVFYWPELRAMLDTKVFVSTDPEVCYRRRLQRDVAERGRTPEYVRAQYERTVRPGAEQFVYPTQAYADLVVSGERPFAESVGAVMEALRLSTPNAHAAPRHDLSRP